MKMNKMFGNIEFGSVKYNLSHLGIAVENAGEKWFLMIKQIMKS